MSRTEGFAVMDVSTSICDDPKFRRIQREHPELVAPAFTAYMATAAESWLSGRRVPIADAWPTIIPYSAEVVGVLTAVRLLDHRGLLPSKTWKSWFEPANQRREALRAKWRQSSTNYRAASSRRQRGVSDESSPPVPYRTVPSDSVPSDPSRTAGYTNGVTSDEDVPPHLRAVNGVDDPARKTA